MDAQNAEGVIQWDSKNTHLYIYTDFVYFHDDIYNWKVEDAKIMCDLDYCNANTAQHNDFNHPDTCVNEVVLPGQSKTELTTNQLCEIVENLNQKFVRKHMVVSTPEIYESLKCKTKMMNYRIKKACGQRVGDEPFVKLDVKTIRSGNWKPDVKRCENMIKVTLPLELQRKTYSSPAVIFHKNNPDQCSKYTSNSGDIEFYYSEVGWILVHGREYFQVTRSDATGIDCCPEEIARGNLNAGFTIEKIIPFRG